MIYEFDKKSLAAVKILSGVDLKWLNIQTRDVEVRLSDYNLVKIELWGSDPQFAELPSEFDKHGWQMDRFEDEFEVNGCFHDWTFWKRLKQEELSRFYKWVKEQVNEEN